MEWTIFDQNTTIRALNSGYQAVFWDILSGKASMKKKGSKKGVRSLRAVAQIGDEVMLP